MNQNLPPESLPSFSPVRENGYLTQEVVVLNKHGLHARPTAMFFEKIVMPHGKALDLIFSVDGRGEFPIKGVFDLMALGLEKGTKILIKIAYDRNSDLSSFSSSEPEMELAERAYGLFSSYFEERDS